MKVLFFGDIVGKLGRQALIQELPSLKRDLEPDLIIANVENLAHGKGVTVDTLNEIQEAGVQVFTSGNHVFRKGGSEEILDGDTYKLIRPANYPPGVSGKGFIRININGTSVLVANLMGRVFFKEDLDDPFRKLDEIISSIQDEPALIIVDWHAEATSEKVALGWHADGRVSAVLGTHTHVPTADARILPQGTGTITDVGMTGARDGILGVEKEGPLYSFTTQLITKFEVPETGTAQINGVYLEIDDKSGRTTRIERQDLEVVIN
jgi:metallophosphoesterase (TIGR00282 family)